MTQVLPAPDVILLLPCYCPSCKGETDHIVDIIAYHAIHHLISYNLTCEYCLMERDEKVVTKQNVSISDWNIMLDEVSDSIRNN